MAAKRRRKSKRQRKRQQVKPAVKSRSVSTKDTPTVNKSSKPEDLKGAQLTSPQVNEEPQKTTEVKKKGGGVRVLVTFLLLGAVAYLGKVRWDDYALNKKYEKFLSEAEAFIADEKFSFASESLTYAEETMPKRPEALELRAVLSEKEAVDTLEKRLVVGLKKLDWDTSQALVKELAEIDPSNPEINRSQELIRIGRLQQKLDTLERALSSAQDKGDLKLVIKLVDELISLSPDHINSMDWKSYKERASKDIARRKKRAETLFQQAKALDSGVYSAQVVYLAKQAKTIDPSEEFITYFDTVSAYPRDIHFPKDYATLQAAVDAAKPIDRIIVSAGSHNAPIIVNKEVHIEGVKGGEVVLHCQGAEGPVIFLGSEGKLVLEGVMCKHSTRAETENAYSALAVQGKLEMVSCVVFDAAGHGVHVLNGGQVEMSGCRIENNFWDGVAVSGVGSKAKIESTIVGKNFHNGIDAWEQGEIRFIKSISEQNSQSGAVSSNGGILQLQRSTLRNNEHSGLYVVDSGSAKVDSSELSGNQMAGGYGSSSGEVSLSNVKALNNKISGIVLIGETNWTGADQVLYTGNVGKDLWKGAKKLTPEKAIVVKDGDLLEEWEQSKDSSDAKNEQTPEEVKE